ncbi:acetolactate synthase [Bifidobacterium actinocoloniiforme DSM 22766]|uniref:Acetolactate synthase n=1 Tax=Bifidobacterium actinocoloniiforme DSM 22766 TaxID=1437605 RepID=A0A086Z0G1_9BIFI|nr:acetolactate synthase large subunit [Bifidobacterium actinocoloniiforme]KFI40011.1 acetolactate synthase [Bifidobacterium actinocoloniiforme DSM 22766]
MLEERGVKYVFGIPGEENIRLVDAIHESPSIQFILVRHEQGASFMAEVYGRLTGQPGIATATLGPGAINLLLGVADAQSNSTPLIAIAAQGGLEHIYKESHQVIDLRAMFTPVTKWSENIYEAQSAPEVIAKAYNEAMNGRPGATFVAMPENVEAAEAVGQTHVPAMPHPVSLPMQEDIKAAADMVRSAQHPIVLAGMGVVRDHAIAEMNAFMTATGLPVATTYMGKGAVDDHDSHSLGVVGFMAHDYENFAFDQADVIVSVGYELSEFKPEKINPRGEVPVIHINAFSADTDAHYPVKININADIASSLQMLQQELGDYHAPTFSAAIRDAIEEELAFGAKESGASLTPQQIVSATREAVDDDGIVLTDTGALKMWMARLYKTYAPNTLLIDNGLSTMSWTLPGAIGAKLAEPNKHVLAMMGDGSFMMNSQELETAHRYQIPLTAMVWVDKAYGLIKWKMDLGLGHHSEVDFNNPDFQQYVESFGGNAHLIESRQQLVDTLKSTLAADEGINVLFVPVDYSENMKLIDKLGKVTISL